jgi:hypothetical protein
MTTMKLYEALAMKTSLQAQLTQLISLRNRSQEYPEDEQPEFNFDSLTNEIKDTVRRLSKLKVEIARANMNTTLTNGKTLFENIIELQNLRSTIDQVKNLIHVEGVGRFSSWGIERRSRKEDVKMLKQKDSQTLLEMLHNYQQRKNALDSLIQQTNHIVEVPEP